jgi:sterol desaturase/sphingolipid hydroxylase (fatty acid hydroxylase superfamily)
LIARAVAVLAGIASWSLLEYLLHRFLGHDARTLPNFFSVEHTRHHGVGDYFAPSWKKAIAALATFGAVAPLASLAAGRELGLAFALSFVAMYGVYEVVHRRAHTHVGIGAYGRWLRRHHFHHHFENPRANHGVTSPVWDLVFGTFEPARRVRVPAKLRMRWLCDPATGQVWPRLAPHYELR